MPGKKHYYKNKDSLTNLITDVGFFAIVLITFIAAGCGLVGCSTLDKLDIPVEVSISYQDSSGNVYVADIGPDGTSLYIDARGELYSINKDGFTITAPDGKGGTTTVRVKRVASDKNFVDLPLTEEELQWLSDSEKDLLEAQRLTEEGIKKIQ